MNKRLVIIDGKSVFYRGYYAMPNLSTKDGIPTGGVFGFATIAMEIVKQLQPDYVCVAWDKAKTNIRSRLALYPQYKAGRKPAPADFYEQIPVLHELLESLGWPLYEIDDYEADDIMAAFAMQAGKAGVESYLITSDLDMLQAINPHTHIYTLKKGFTNIELFNEASFMEKYGVKPTQWVDVKSLKGDSSDNIPGVTGIGEKTALSLIKQYDNLDNVYLHLDELKPAVRQKLERDKDMAYLSKKLVTLMADAPIKLDLTDARVDDAVTPEFVAMLRKLEFKTLLRQAESRLTKQEIIEVEAPLIHLDLAKEMAFVAADYAHDSPRVIALNSDLNQLWVSADQKSYSIISLTNDPSLDLVQSLFEVSTLYPNLDKMLFKTLQAGSLVGHDLKKLFRILLEHGHDWTGTIGHDTKIGAFLLNSLNRSTDLSDILDQPIDNADPEQVIAAIWQARHDQVAQFDELPELASLAQDVEFPTTHLLAKIEHRGIALDGARLEDMSRQFEVRIKEFEQKIYELAGQEFNVGSPSQLAVVLFEKMGLPTKNIKKGKTGYSTGVNELNKLRDLNPIIDLITYYREYLKLKNTYLDTLPKLVDSNSRLHTTFTLDVTATGRLSSHNPNLQNIPTRNELGKAIRSAFVPAAGNVFVSADYSQFELRLIAVMAQDQGLMDSFNRGEDIHTRTASEVYDLPIEQITKKQRRNAKIVNFGILYGMSPHGLSLATGMTRDEAKMFIDKYFKLHHKVQTFMDQVADNALKDGYVQTIFGRRRPTPDLKSSNFIVRESARRAAINMPIQGTEADLMKMAMLKVEENLAGKGQQILQIHDSIMVECPSKNQEQVSEILRSTMENIYKLPVVLKVDITIGNNWGEL